MQREQYTHTKTHIERTQTQCIRRHIRNNTMHSLRATKNKQYNHGERNNTRINTQQTTQTQTINTLRIDKDAHFEESMNTEGEQRQTTHHTH